MDHNIFFKFYFIFLSEGCWEGKKGWCSLGWRSRQREVKAFSRSVFKHWKHVSASPCREDRSLWMSLHFCPSIFPLTGARACTSKCNKNPDRKQKKDITKCCPTVYLFQCNTRDQEIISAHTTDDSESLDDHEILLYSSINVKIAKICFTRFFKELCLRLFYFFFIDIWIAV